MGNYKFDVERFCQSRARSARAMRNFADEENFKEIARQFVEVKEALKDCVSGLKYIRHVHGDLYGVGWDRAIENADKILEEK